MTNVDERAGGLQGGVNISFSEYNSATVRNILMVLGRIIEKVTAESHV